MINGWKYIVSGWSKLKTRNLYLFQNNQRHSLLRLANLMPTRQLEHLLAIESIWNTYILEERERESRCFLMNFHALGQEEKSMCLPMCQKSIIESMEWHHFLTEESFGLQHSYLLFPKKGPRTKMCIDNIILSLFLGLYPPGILLDHKSGIKPCVHPGILIMCPCSYQEYQWIGTREGKTLKDGQVRLGLSKNLEDKSCSLSFLDCIGNRNLCGGQVSSSVSNRRIFSSLSTTKTKASAVLVYCLPSFLNSLDINFVSEWLLAGEKTSAKKFGLADRFDNGSCL